MRTLENLRHQPVGFQTEGLATFNLDPTSSGYGDDRTPRIVTNALEAIARIPSVSQAAATTDPDLFGNGNQSNFTVEGHKATEDENMNFEAPYVTPGFFATMKQPL